MHTEEKLIGEVDSTVTENELASKIGSGDVEVYSTPSMIALMEAASVKCLSSKLTSDQTSVGTMISIKHLAATPISCKVRAVAELIEIQDGKKALFNITAFDEKEKIGEGTHERFILNKERFVQRTNQKLNK